MNRIVVGYPGGPRTVDKQNPVTKLDFLKARMVIKLIILGAFIAGLSLFYIWSRIQIVQIGYEINELKNEQQVLQDQQNRLRLELSLMKSPARIRAYARDVLKLDYPETLTRIRQ